MGKEGKGRSQEVEEYYGRGCEESKVQELRERVIREFS